MHHSAVLCCAVLCCAVLCYVTPANRHDHCIYVLLTAHACGMLQHIGSMLLLMQPVLGLPKLMCMLHSNNACISECVMCMPQNATEC